MAFISRKSLTNMVACRITSVNADQRIQNRLILDAVRAGCRHPTLLPPSEWGSTFHMCVWLAMP